MLMRTMSLSQWHCTVTQKLSLFHVKKFLIKMKHDTISMCKDITCKSYTHTHYNMFAVKSYCRTLHN